MFCFSKGLLNQKCYFKKLWSTYIHVKVYLHLQLYTVEPLNINAATLHTFNNLLFFFRFPLQRSKWGANLGAAFLFYSKHKMTSSFQRPTTLIQKNFKGHILFLIYCKNFYFKVKSKSIYSPSSSNKKSIWSKVYVLKNKNVERRLIQIPTVGQKTISDRHVQCLYR